MTPDLIFCAAGNQRMAQIAIDAGYKFGARLPGTVYHPVYFADQNWKKPDRAAYMAALEKHKPHMASVLDWERDDQLAEVMEWSEQAAQYVDVVMIIPKVHGGIARLPRAISNKQVRLGYSVPTKHGGTEVSISEFVGWPVHLLGGSPGAQQRNSYYLNVASADGNMMIKMSQRGLFWEQGKSAFSNSWVSLLERDGARFDGDGNLEALRRSCVNIMAAWRKLYEVTNVSIS